MNIEERIYPCPNSGLKDKEFDCTMTGCTGKHVVIWNHDMWSHKNTFVQYVPCWVCEERKGS